MNARTAGYWATTGLLALGTMAGAVFDLTQHPAVVQALSHLGYPLYVAPLLGTWKLLGVLAVVAPRAPRLKEWAYAGFFFDLSGAAVSHLASGDGLGGAASPLVLLGLTVASWALRPASRTLPAREPGGPGSGRAPLAEPHAA